MALTYFIGDEYYYELPDVEQEPSCDSSAVTFTVELLSSSIQAQRQVTKEMFITELTE